MKQKLDAFPGSFLCCCEGGGEGRSNNSVRNLSSLFFSQLLDHTLVGASLASSLLTFLRPVVLLSLFWDEEARGWGGRAAEKKA